METTTVFLPNKECLIGRAKVDKVGKLHKAKRQIKVQKVCSNLEATFMHLAQRDKKRESQKSERALKRAMRK